MLATHFKKPLSLCHEHRLNKITAIACFALCCLSLPVRADTLNYNLYHLSADAEIIVENDLMQVTLTASHQASRAKQASEAVNAQMNWALKKAKATRDIVVKTGSYQTNAVYKSSKITAWRATQRLELKSENFEALANLVGQLQEKLKVNSMQFKVSKAARNVAEDKATRAALKRFQHRAELVQSSVGATAFDVVTVNVNANSVAQPRYRQARMAKSLSFADTESVEVEGGSSTLSVQVAGQIQLKP